MVWPVLTPAHQLLHRLELDPVLPSLVPDRVPPYSCSAQRVMSSVGSTWAVLKSPQRFRPVAVEKVL